MSTEVKGGRGLNCAFTTPFLTGNTVATSPLLSSYWPRTAVIARTPATTSGLISGVNMHHGAEVELFMGIFNKFMSPR